MIFKGRVWKFGDNVPTDVITPIAILFKPIEEIARHVLAAANPEFPKKVQRGDIIVAGQNFGCSSGRAVAPKAIRAAGVSVVLAESFSRTFYRNAHEVGLPILIAPGISRKVDEGDLLEANIETGEISNLTKGERLRGEPSPPFLLEMLRSGGLIPYLEKTGALKT
jgi:3-isopropylmalate/(R)-2-methylmalate dehydratase small subunit